MEKHLLGKQMADPVFIDITTFSPCIGNFHREIEPHTGQGTRQQLDFRAHSVVFRVLMSFCRPLVPMNFYAIISIENTNWGHIINEAN